ncbi:hypothetical protein SSX86_031157 [Deinandra increscens subsp. villosa]|uniref:TIR domain-containing protein n=1 Tax=Deinandra increscens subsp. villosa TaxID=3103831 RepID=A0AAP0GIZ8_9ASTR
MLASTSVSSTPQKRFKYDVFVSYRGEDTHKPFVDHLYHALHKNGITTYTGYETIEKRRKVSDDDLVTSIQDSKIHIIVFSNNYASSSWCLDDLVKIMECQNENTTTAYPIFYDVEPTEVRNQCGAFGEAFAKHENEEAADRWRGALREAAGLAGRELKTTFTLDWHKAEFIKNLVEDISQKLFHEYLVGMETRVSNVVSSLETGVNDVRLIGIKGMGGGGKTTLARAVFYHISFLFEGKSFVENVKGSSLKELQKQVLQDVSSDRRIDVESINDGRNKMKRMMGSRKVLVVLDDVDNIGQFEALAGEPTWFKPGSRIIITTRDEQVLNPQRVSFTHDISLLSDDEAICLFSKYAFGRKVSGQGYEELSRKVVHYAAGLPITIKVLGSLLYAKSKDEWEETIERLKTNLPKETLEILEQSYNGLKDDQKEIFLDVACILNGEKEKKAIRVLESCGFHARVGLKVLKQKSLITISDTDCLRLHDHIAEMGRYIVRGFYPHEPNRHNRLWIKEEIEDILINDLGTNRTRCIKLEDSELDSAIIMKGLRKMNEVRFLYVNNGYKPDVHASPSSYNHASLPNALQYLYWHSYPLSCLPETFRANNLVNLEMPYSNISQLWEEVHMPVQFPKLKHLNLNGSKLSNLDLRQAPCIESLYLRDCNNFVELHLPFECPRLKYLCLSGSKLRKLNLGLTPNLMTLDLSRCNYFVELLMPVQRLKLKYLHLSGSKLSKLNLWLTPHLKSLEGLQELTLSTEDIKRLPDSICMLEHLTLIELKSCFHLEQLPKDLGRLECLKKLHLSDCISLQDIPNSICNMKCLKYLHLPYCVLVEKLPDELGRLKCLEELNIEGTGINQLPQSIFQLEDLCIIWSRGRLESYGFSSLKELSRYTASCYIKNKKSTHRGVS